MQLPNNMDKHEGDFSASEFAIIILSCDKFHDVWMPLIFSFKKYWGDCPFEIFILSNYKKVVDPNIKNIYVGEDISWSQNLINALDKIPHKNVILWLDDVFITDDVCTNRILNDAKWFFDNEIDYLRLRSTDSRLMASPKSYENIKEDAPYRTSIFATIWRKEVLSNLIVKDENPWQFELRGSERSKKYKRFYSVKSTRIRYIHAVEKGIWIRTAVKWIKNNNLPIDLEYRRQFSLTEHIFMTLAKLKGFFINILPSKSRGSILKLARSFYLWTGLRDETHYKNN